ncbi:Alpha/Beta hydrolase protein [Mycena amicta]|nr:Alpha/Beta hydrolase protein [Mycena amicta]
MALQRNESTIEVYTRWAKESGNEVSVDELGENARLLWLGPKTLSGHVLLVYHGTSSDSAEDNWTPPPDFALSCWRYVKEQVEKTGSDLGVAVLNYNLLPTAKFPVQLNQARLALSFLINSGVSPRNIHIAGDSAGGNLALQLLSHVLHPHPDVPRLTLSQPLRGVYLFSPWAIWSKSSPSWVENAGIDYLPASMMSPDSAIVRSTFGVSEQDKAFAEPGLAEVDWFTGLDKCVDQILVAGGSAECMRDDIVKLGSVLQKQHRNVEVFIQHGGLHVDMILDFFAREPKVGSLTRMLVERLIEEARA